MSNRELVVLGTASQVPTRYRNHNGYFVRWDREGLLFDPGEGTQRQLILAGVPARAITKIFITHFHGDHSLGLAGVLQRLNLDRCPHPVEVYFPAEDEIYFHRLRDATHYNRHLTILPRPVEGEHWEGRCSNGWRVEARPLQHPVPTFGYRISEPGTFRFHRQRLDAMGLRGPDIGRLGREGEILHRGRKVSLWDVADSQPGMVLAFIMDTRFCQAALCLAEGADLAIIESTYLEDNSDLAHDHGHLTARQAGEIARRAGVRQLILGHFSQRYPAAEQFQEEAAREHTLVQAVKDLERVSIPWGRKALRAPERKAAHED